MQTLQKSKLPFLVRVLYYKLRLKCSNKLKRACVKENTIAENWILIQGTVAMALLVLCENSE